MLTHILIAAVSSVASKSSPSITTADGSVLVSVPEGSRFEVETGGTKVDLSGAITFVLPKPVLHYS